MRLTAPGSGLPVPSTPRSGKAPQAEQVRPGVVPRPGRSGADVSGTQVGPGASGCPRAVVQPAGLFAMHAAGPPVFLPVRQGRSPSPGFAARMCDKQ
jgi:hypothetical protein